MNWATGEHICNNIYLICDRPKGIKGENGKMVF